MAGNNALIELIANIINPKPQKVSAVAANQIHAYDSDVALKGIKLVWDVIGYIAPFVATGLLVANCGPLGFFAYPILKKFLGKDAMNIVHDAKTKAAEGKPEAGVYHTQAEIMKAAKEMNDKGK